MAIERIPLDSTDPSFVQTTPLSGSDYDLDFDWNERAGHWLLSVTTSEGVNLINGAVLAPGVPVLARSTSEDKPPGDLIPIADGAVLGRNDLDNLFYVTDDDLAQVYDSLGIPQ